MESLSKAKLKLFSALQHKKYRQQHGLFLVEGKKMVAEALHSDYPVETVVVRENVGELENLVQNKEINAFSLSEVDFGKLSSVKNPEGVLAVVQMPETPKVFPPPGKAILLYNLQDPGNLGTIIRTAAWFGIRNIICSSDTVDVFNPKTLRATMGAVFSTQVHYLNDFEEMLHAHAEKVLVADLSGTPVSGALPQGRDWILIGNEANGLPENILSIPGLEAIRIPGGGTESLNAAVSAGILAFCLTQLS